MNTKSQINDCISVLERNKGIFDSPTNIRDIAVVRITTDTLSRALRRHSKSGYRGIERAYWTTNSGKRIAVYGIAK